MCWQGEGGLTQPLPRHFWRLGSFCGASGDPPKSRQGRGLACADRAGPSSRLPATPSPALGEARGVPPRWPGGPRWRGWPWARPRDCSPPLPGVRAGGPRVTHSAPLPHPLMERRFRTPLASTSLLILSLRLRRYRLPLWEPCPRR